MKLYVILGIVLVLVVLLIVWFITTYNKLVKLRNSVKDQWSQIDVQLKKRFDMIPNMVEIVKGYAKHEEETLTAVVEARNTAVSAQNPKDEIEANKNLSGALSKLFALSESYPELKADKNFLQLQNDLKAVEDKIAYARQFYNDCVYKYKNTIETFPTVLIAGMLGFKQVEFFEASNEEKQNVTVKF